MGSSLREEERPRSLMNRPERGRPAATLVSGGRDRQVGGGLGGGLSGREDEIREGFRQPRDRQGRGLLRRAFDAYVGAVQRTVDALTPRGGTDSESLGLDPDSSGGRANDFRDGFNAGSVQGLYNQLRYNLTGEAPLKPGDTDAEGTSYGGQPEISERVWGRLAEQFNENPVAPYMLARAKEDELPGADQFARALIRSQEYGGSRVDEPTFSPESLTSVVEWAEADRPMSGPDESVAYRLYETLTGESPYTAKEGGMSPEDMQQWVKQHFSLPEGQQQSGQTVMTQ